MRESALERKLVFEVRKIGGAACKWTSPGASGVPDRIVLLPGGRVAFVEMKAPGKQLEPLQEYWRKKLQGMGHDHFTIDSVEGIHKFIEWVQA